MTAETGLISVTGSKRGPTRSARGKAPPGAAGSALARRLGRRVVTVDLDGTAFDPWACCGRRDPSHFGTPACRHLRADVLAEVRATVEATGSALTVLSWRSGMVEASRDWLAAVGIDAAAVFIPGSDDDIADAYLDRTPPRAVGQGRFKAATVMALAAAGVEVVRSWDNSPAVVEILGSLGVSATLVPALAHPTPWEWAAGRLGAPRPPDPGGLSPRIPRLQAWRCPRPSMLRIGATS